MGTKLGVKSRRLNRGIENILQWPKIAKYDHESDSRDNLHICHSLMRAALLVCQPTPRAHSHQNWPFVSRKSTRHKQWHIPAVPNTALLSQPDISGPGSLDKLVTPMCLRPALCMFSTKHASPKNKAKKKKCY